VSEALMLAMSGGLLGALAAYGLIFVMAHTPQTGLFLAGMSVTVPTVVAAMTVAATLGLVSSVVPAYNASRKNIVDGLRYVG
jgi:putative ABC transport system permease protein